MRGTLPNAQTNQKGITGNLVLLCVAVALALGHIGVSFSELFSPVGVALQFVGHAAGPVLFYLLVEGYYRARNILRAANVLAGFAALSYLPYILFVTGSLPTADTFLTLSLLFTLLIGLYLLRARHEIKNRGLRMGAIVALVILSILCDWPVFGALYVLVLDVYRERPKIKWSALALLIVLSALPESPAQWPYTITQLGQLVPLIFLPFYNVEKGQPTPKGWVAFCVFYIVHLLVIYFAVK